MSEQTPQILSGADLPVCLVSDGKLADCLVFIRTVDCVAYAPLKILLECPEGTSWDGATIPRICWSVIGHPLQREFRFASLFHDRACERAVTLEQRAMGDAIFRELLRQAGVCWWRRTAMWLAVRVYGWYLFHVRAS